MTIKEYLESNGIGSAQGFVCTYRTSGLPSSMAINDNQEEVDIDNSLLEQAEAEFTGARVEATLENGEISLRRLPDADDSWKELYKKDHRDLFG